jgi:hypothetical protein
MCNACPTFPLLCIASFVRKGHAKLPTVTSVFFLLDHHYFREMLPCWAT